MGGLPGQLDTRNAVEKRTLVEARSVLSTSFRLPTHPARGPLEASSRADPWRTLSERTDVQGACNWTLQVWRRESWHLKGALYKAPLKRCRGV